MSKIRVPVAPSISVQPQDPRAILTRWGYTPEQANEMVSWKGRQYQDQLDLAKKQAKANAWAPLMQAGGTLGGALLAKALLGGKSSLLGGLFDSGSNAATDLLAAGGQASPYANAMVSSLANPADGFYMPGGESLPGSDVFSVDKSVDLSNPGSIWDDIAGASADPSSLVDTGSYFMPGGADTVGATGSFADTAGATGEWTDPSWFDTFASWLGF